LISSLKLVAPVVVLIEVDSHITVVSNRTAISLAYNFVMRAKVRKSEQSHCRGEANVPALNAFGLNKLAHILKKRSFQAAC
jgi:hypothetical protein